LIEPEVSPVRCEDLEKSVATTTALFTRHLESAIRRYPEQWNWLGFPRNDRIPRSEDKKETLQMHRPTFAPDQIDEG
jgi:lauroyl/myristoyl acyltransferase